MREGWRKVREEMEEGVREGGMNDGGWEREHWRVWEEVIERE